MSRHLHIVMHEVPWPVNFGGVTDLYHKIKWLHAAGIKIHLHCFVKKHPPQAYLEKYCESLYYYQRKSLSGISLRLPFIVASRTDADLLKNLNKDDHPVLLEGVHCSYHLYTNALKHRRVFLRLHNTEHKYYARLAKNEDHFLKRLYFRNEARLLKKYEAIIAAKCPVWAVSTADADHYCEAFSADAHFLPVFLPWDLISGKSGKGNYCLYHGNLSVNENEKAAAWLIDSVFNDSKMSLIIAGKAPSGKLQMLVRKHKNIRLVKDPSEAEMQKLIEDAHVNVLPSFNNTGVKLKLLNALFNGRHCLVNEAGTEGSGLNDLCSIAETAAEFKAAVIELFAEPYTEAKIRHRSTALKAVYNNEQNARRLIAWIW